MNYCILFSRVSTAVQQLESQTIELEREAERMGYHKDQQILIEYKESAISLSADERKGIQELKQRIQENNNIDCVIVYEISRLSRQTTMLFELRDWFIQNTIQLVCCKPYFRLLEDGKLSQTASIVFSLMTSLSESEMVIKKERMMRGKIFKKEQGKYIGGRILLGYKVGQDDNIEIDYKDAETVRKIFQWYADGKSMVYIARELESRGSVNGRWNGINSIICCIKITLRREEYTGKIVKGYFYPRIITDELFNDVQKLITRNKSKTITKKKYLGQGLIKEEGCNLTLSPNELHYNISRIEFHGTVNLNTKVIEEWLWKICEERAKTISKDKAEANYLHDVNVLNNKIKTNEIYKQELLKRIDKVNERVVSGKMNEAKGDGMIKNIEHEIKQLESKHEEYTKKLIDLKPYEVDLSDRKSVVNSEIEVIWTKKLENELKYKRKNLEVHFKDGSIKTYIYYQKAQRIFIKLDGKIIVENEKIAIEKNFNRF